MIELELKNPQGETKKLSFPKKIIAIGREADNDVLLVESGNKEKIVSRYHAEIRLENDKYFICDLNSTNGTFCNNERIEDRQELLPQSEIMIGDFVLVFNGNHVEKNEEEKNVEKKIEEEIEIEEGAQTSFFPAHELAKKASEGQDEPEIINKNLEILYNMGKKLLNIKDVGEIASLCISNIEEIVKAERIVFQLKNKDGELETLDCKITDGEKNLRLSRTITSKVLNDGLALFSLDAGEDKRFSESESLLIQSVRSMMCVPIWTENNFLGLIYLDNRKAQTVFQEADLQIISAIANQAAISIENIYLQEDIREEAKIRSNLERYHSPDVVDKIINTEGSQFETEEKTVTVLFSDIKGFTHLSEQHSPRVITDLLNEYFEKMTEIIFANNGTLDKFIGDAIMAIFGAPITYGNDARNAANAALDMLKARKELMMGKDDNYRFDIRIGINTGKVIAGSIGSRKCLDYTVLGDPVNVASRLESKANTNSVFIGEMTYELVKDDFEFTEIGPTELKGKTQKVMVYEVTGRKKK